MTTEIESMNDLKFKHRHHICKAPRLCKTFFITNICRLKETGQNKYISHNDFFLQRLSHNIFLIISFSQRLCHIVALTYSSTQGSPHNVTIYA